MKFTNTESQIVRQLGRDRVAKWQAFAEQLERSTKTVQRALAKVGYFRSINHDANFVTLSENETVKMAERFSCGATSNAVAGSGRVGRGSRVAPCRRDWTVCRQV